MFALNINLILIDILSISILLKFVPILLHCSTTTKKKPATHTEYTCKYKYIIFYKIKSTDTKCLLINKRI